MQNPASHASGVFDSDREWQHTASTANGKSRR